MLNNVELKEYLDDVFSKGKLKLDVDIESNGDCTLCVRLKDEKKLKKIKGIEPRCFIDFIYFGETYDSPKEDYIINFNIANESYTKLSLENLKIGCNTPEKVAQCIYGFFTGKKGFPVSYVAEIFKGKKNYSGCFLDFDGCVFADKDFYKCIQRAKGALALHLEGMLEDGDSLPVPKYWVRNKQDKEGGEESYLVLIETEIKIGGKNE